MTVEEAFHREIREHPEDDTPRLIYADWLEEQGDPRGEFIRVQCEFANLTEYAPQRRVLYARQQELLAEYGDEWTKDLTALDITPYFTRGMIEEVKLSGARFLEIGDTLQTITPTLRGVELRKAAPVIGAIANSPDLARITELKIRVGGLEPTHVRELLSSPYISQLKRLDMSGNRLRANGATAIANSPNLANLDYLDLYANDLTPVAGRALGSSKLLPSLRVLELGGNEGFGRQGLGQLAEGRELPALEELRLGRCNLHLDGLRMLVAASWCPQLRTLKINNNPLGSVGLRTLVGSPAISELNSLDINHCQFRNEDSQGGLSDSRGFTDAERAGFLAGNDGGTLVTPHHRHQIAVRDGGVLDELPRFGHPEGNVHLGGKPTRHPNDRRAGRNGTVFEGPEGAKLHSDEVKRFFVEKGQRLVKDPQTGLWVEPR